MANRIVPPNCGCPGRLPAPVTRREMLASTANGFGMLAFTGLFGRSMSAATIQSGERIPKPHYGPKVKNVIFCFMDGGVSHVDSFDPKPKLAELDGKLFTESKNPTANGNRKWLHSPWEFRQHGESGMPVSSLFPHIANCADDIAVIRSMKADLPIHSTGVLFLHTGSNNAGRPSLGSWVNYGLGCESQNLPGFVVLSFGVVPCGGLETFSNGFLPASQQATLLQADGSPIDNIQPADADARIQRAKLSLLKRKTNRFLGGLAATTRSNRPSRTTRWRFECNRWFPMSSICRARPNRSRRCMGLIPRFLRSACMEFNACVRDAWWNREFDSLRSPVLPVLRTEPGINTGI